MNTFKSIISKTQNENTNSGENSFDICSPKMISLNDFYKYIARSYQYTQKHEPLILKKMDKGYKEKFHTEAYM